MGLALVLAACGAQEGVAGATAGSAKAATSDAVKRAKSGLSERQQQRLDEAMRKARAGESPTHDCTMLVGVAAGRPVAAGQAPDASAAAVLEACYVDATVLYAKAKLAEMRDASHEEASDFACAQIGSHYAVLSTAMASYLRTFGLDRQQLEARIVASVGEADIGSCPVFAAQMGRG